METTFRIIGVSFAAISGLFLLIFRGQNKRIDDLERKKTDKSLCKTVHATINRNDIDNKETLKDIQKSAADQAVATGKIEAHMEGLKDSIDKLVG